MIYSKSNIIRIIINNVTIIQIKKLLNKKKSVCKEILYF